MGTVRVQVVGRCIAQTGLRQYRRIERHAATIDLRPFRSTLLYRVVDSEGARAFDSSHTCHSSLLDRIVDRGRRRCDESNAIDAKPLPAKLFTCELN
jgi:hypothetical protein